MTWRLYSQLAGPGPHQWIEAQLGPRIQLRNPETGEIREPGMSLSALIDESDRAWGILGEIAEALGEDVLTLWESGDEEPSFLVGEVRKLRELPAEVEPSPSNQEYQRARERHEAWLQAERGETQP